MFRTTQQRPAGRKKRIEGERRFEDLGRKIGVSRGRAEARGKARVELDLSAVRELAVDVDVLSLAETWVEREIYLVAEEVVEVGGGGGVSAAGKRLLDASLERCGFFRLERGIGKNGESATLSERLFEAWRLDALGVDEAQARAAECMATAQR